MTAEARAFSQPMPFLHPFVGLHRGSTVCFYAGGINKAVRGPWALAGAATRPAACGIVSQASPLHTWPHHPPFTHTPACAYPSSQHQYVHVPHLQATPFSVRSACLCVCLASASCSNRIQWRTSASRRMWRRARCRRYARERQVEGVCVLSGLAWLVLLACVYRACFTAPYNADTGPRARH